MVQALDEAADHLPEFFEAVPKLPLPVSIDKVAAHGQFKQRKALEDRPPCDREEVLAIGRRESAVALGEIGGNGDGGAVQLIGEEAVAARKVLGGGENLVGEVDGLLVKLEVLDGERHAREFSVDRESRE